MYFSGKANCQFKPGTLKRSKPTEHNLGETVTPHECTAMVLRNFPHANGAKWGYGIDQHGSCWAQFGATGHHVPLPTWNGKWISCLLTCML